ncbi:hypothetical protein LSAT2_016498 [Lamellibrachia satsuma]|nr:hypothetical protein LSAT2_016498 [Lamellibrachia satsuma]
MHKYKAELFADMSEDADKSGRPLRILDVGSGAGSNFKYFPANSDVICVEPNDKFESYLRKSVAENSSHTHLKEFIVGYAEDMATIPSDSIDAAVCTLVLCNVDDIDQSLSEIKRVLKTGGKLYYMEHVCADTSTWTYLAQRLVSPLWQHTIGSGCRFTQKTWLHVENAGFRRVSQRRFIAYEMGCRRFLLRPHLLGIATK